MTAEAERERPSPWKTPFALRAYAAGALWLAGVIAQWLTHVPDQPGWLAVRFDLAGLLYLAASFAGGLNFFGAGVRALRRLRLDMNFLMSAAIVAAILIGEPFEAATLAFLFSVAELLERYAMDRSRRSIAQLLQLAPEQAERLRPDGSTEAVPARDLKVGDYIRVRPGDRIGADGRIVAGGSSINEAAITGESLPRTKSSGDTVFSGSLNLDGSLDIEVTADASHSVVARMVELVRAAEGRRAPIEYFVQRFARVYTPIVTLAAVAIIVLPPLLDFWGTPLQWFTRGITLLVIACPCALVIATPVTVVSALTSAARHGVLIKGGEHLEGLGSIRALATDKTGTLTTGRLEVSEFRVTPASAEAELLQLLATVEARSEHPIGKAIVRFANARGVLPGKEVREFKALPGHGLIANAAGVLLAVGTESVVGGEVARLWGELAPGTSWVFATADASRASGLIGLQDAVRPEAKRFVDRLHGLQVRPVVLLTGDGEEVARKIGSLTGVDEVRARLLPEEKVQAVRELRSRYHRVAMIGDGVNDAPALAEASVGIAMGVAGSPAAIETADVALMADDLSKVPYAVRLARRARRTIRFNIALAIGLKLILALGAVSSRVSLAEAVLFGDLGASLVVTLNALRLAAMRAD